MNFSCFYSWLLCLVLHFQLFFGFGSDLVAVVTVLNVGIYSFSLLVLTVGVVFFVPRERFCSLSENVPVFS